MKNLKYFIFALLAISLTACSNSALKLESKKINGPLGKFYEVVEKDYHINDKSVSIELKRIAEGGPEDASWTTYPTFTVELFDKSDNLINSESTDVVFTKEQLETVFALGVDERASITFNFSKTKGAVKMKISSKWDEKAEKEESNNSYAAESDEGITVYRSSDSDDDDDDWDDIEKAAKATKSAYKAAKTAYKVAKELEDEDWD